MPVADTTTTTQRSDQPDDDKRSAEPVPLPERVCRVLLWLAIAAYAFGIGSLCFARHDRLVTTVFDLGIFDQAVWLMSRGHPLFLTTRGMTPFADHFTPILYLIAPLYRIWSSPKTLLAVQAVAMALGALPVYHLAHKRVKSPMLGLLFAVSYLLYPALLWMNLFDFHPDVFTTPLLLFAFWFLEQRRTVPYLTVIVLSLLCKETMGLTVVLMGFYAGTKAGWRLGAATSALGVIGTLVSVGTLRTLNHGQPSAYFSLYSAYGDSMGAIAWHLLTHPGEVLSVLLDGENTGYLVSLFLPVLGLSLLAPEVLLIAAPAFLSNMLSSRPAMHTIHYQYSAIVIPFIFVAAIEGARSVHEFLLRRLPRDDIAIQAGLAVQLGMGLFLGFVTGPLALGGDGVPTGPTDARPYLVRALAMIGPEASVSAQTAVAAHLTERRRIYMFPNPFYPICWGNSVLALEHQAGRSLEQIPAAAFNRSVEASDVEFVVLGPDDTSHWALDDDGFRYYASLTLRHPAYGVVFADRDMVVLRRGADHAAGLRQLKREGGYFEELLSPQ